VGEPGGRGVQTLSLVISSRGGEAASRGKYLKDLLLVLTQKEIKVRYKSSWLGYVWSLANPLAFALIYFIAFGIFMRIQIPHYPLFLITGLFPWQWLSNSINASPNIFLLNASLLKKVRFPRNVLVAVTVLNDAAHFVFSIPVVVGLLFVYGLAPSWSWLAGIPLLVLAQFSLVYGLALAISSLNLFFRDLERLTTLLLTFLLFLTPVVYADSMIPHEYRALIYVNPIAPLILSWRQLFLDGELAWPGLGLTYLYALIALGVGSVVYRKLSWKFAEVV
jgi:lipopolysaccharide transport system permease protein